MIKKAWAKGGKGETGLTLAKEKIKVCGTELLAWGSSKTNPDTEEIKRLQHRIEALNSAEATMENRAEFLEVSKKMDALLMKQEIFWAQRSRIPWLKHGDRNTKFFHAKASQWRRKNYIQRIKNGDNEWVDGSDDIAKVATDYFENLFLVGRCDQKEECLSVVPHKVTLEMQEVLSSDFSAEEVKAALFQMGPTKAPGPDGMNALFYQKFWNVVSNNVVNDVLDFLNFGIMVPDVNHTNIVLIPKIKSPEKMFDFRPISLCNVIYKIISKVCNVIYKIISKVLENHLKQILPQIISPTQSAFVPRRLITDNVLVAYETLHAMHCRKKGKKGSLALKLDISKAYDRVEWPFLHRVMSKLGFPEKWISRVIECVTTPSFSILINGKPYGNISPSRGLRQGDPLSPYLFLLCAEGFTSLLTRAEMEGCITGVSICRRAPTISNLLFADDSLLFCQTAHREVEEITKILQVYA